MTIKNQIATTKIVEAKFQSTQWVKGKYALSTINVRKTILRIFNENSIAVAVIRAMNRFFGLTSAVEKIRIKSK